MPCPYSTQGGSKFGVRPPDPDHKSIGSRRQFADLQCINLGIILEYDTLHRIKEGLGNIIDILRFILLLCELDLYGDKQPLLVGPPVFLVRGQDILE